MGSAKILNGKNRNIDTSNLPRVTKSSHIIWSKTLGMEVPFHYGDIEGSFEITNFTRKNNRTVLTIRHNSKTIDVSSTEVLKCAIGELFTKTIYETNPEYINKYGISIEDAKKYSIGSGQIIKVICPFCLHEKEVTIYNIQKYNGIGCNCGDGFSYPEKFIFNLLNQLNLSFKTQLNKSTFAWCKKYKYDFYFNYNNKQYIIETHGKQHYNYSFNYDGARTVEQEQQNDKLKRKIAINNGIDEDNYIVLDCRHSNMEWIKSNILNSKLNMIFNLDKISWIKCEEYALSNKIKEVCNYYKSITKDIEVISIVFGLTTVCIKNYLRKGTILQWCDYNVPKRKINKKNVEIFKNEISLGIFKSCADLERKSEQILGIHLVQSKISKACLTQKLYKGFKITYV